MAIGLSLGGMPELDVGPDFGLILCIRGGSEKVEKDLRASLAAAGAAAALSALVGIIAGIGFFVLILRAIVCGLVLGAAVYGGSILIQRLAPGMLDIDGEAREAVASEPPGPLELGANVDIVLPEEPIETDALLSDVEPAAAAISLESAVEPGFIEEASLLEPEIESAAAPTAIPPHAAAERTLRPSSDFDELDVLPDLDGFSDSFTASEFASGGSSAERPDRSPSVSSGGGSSGSRAGQEGLDPATLAQAVRTILKRDQKG
jgi:uncharacterized membrane protein YgcG